jgi:O-antigen biosynthesis protein
VAELNLSILSLTRDRRIYCKPPFARVAMNLSDFQIAYTPPRYLSPLSAWVEHIPFAFALMQLLRPRTFVELGVHLGDSYCAFCQAADVLSLETRCTGIDTWQGDSQSGEYGPENLEALRAHHDPQYGRFSRLAQTTFDDAARGVADQSIDLLHLDGLHTYDAVRNDVGTWLPKLSPRGMLLMHDTRVTRDGFGVHKVWAELRGRFPSFEFYHGSGLGVLAAGAEPVPEVGAFLKEANREPDATRAFFAAVGGRLLLARTVARNDLIARRRGLGEADGVGINLAPPVERLLDPATDLKEAMDEHTSAVRGRLRRVVRRLQRWSRGSR